ncbi:hypothetical protein L227DRAFT_514792 [Lentinus tigrinus ALCF2SS1-6]|uniref:DUF659 domain-containing protein n=1 Tax=Lentinus tigrinus ALCF2SS1-6 TaxID=1328759 RepID=A0A5C2RMA2_9APHY|nr:hypothetical protein L227DRAFT_514792 [Lentinus tigrinus ALCF2SS1-6]
MLTASEQIHGITVDNASNNMTMLTHMSTLIPGFRGVLLHVRCFGHILNIILKVCHTSQQRTWQELLSIVCAGHPLAIQEASQG